MSSEDILRKQLQERGENVEGQGLAEMCHRAVELNMMTPETAAELCRSLPPAETASSDS